MKKILFGVAALGLLGLAGAGLGLKAQDVIETKAWTDGQLTSVWLGYTNNWAWTKDTMFTYVGETKDGSTDCADFEFVVHLEAGNAFKVVANNHWSNAHVANSNLTGGTDESNIEVVNTGTYRLHFRTDFSSVYYLYQLDEVSEEDKNTVYFVNGHSWENVYLYAYNNEGEDEAWPGKNDLAVATDMTLKCYVGETEYEGIKIFTAEVPAKYNWLIFNIGSDASQTANLYAKNGAVYWFGPDAAVYNEIVDWMLGVKSSLGAGSYEGRDYAKSICGITTERANSILSGYDTIVAKGGAYESGVKGSTIVMNDYTKADGNTQVFTLEEIADTLRNIVLPGKASPTYNTAAVANNSFVPIAAITICGVIATGAAFIFWRKKKEN